MQPGFRSMSPAPAPGSDQPLAAGGRCHVLLAEDHDANILVASTILDDMGIGCDVARDGQEALQMVRSGRAKYAAVLMDVRMPVMDGYDATAMIRIEEKTGGFARLPIIGLTAHALAGDRGRCLQAGMDDYIAKPFNPAELRAKLDALLRQAGGKDDIAAQRCA